MKKSSIKLIHLNQGEILKLKSHNPLELFSNYKKKNTLKKKKKSLISNEGFNPSKTFTRNLSEKSINIHEQK